MNTNVSSINATTNVWMDLIIALNNTINIANETKLGNLYKDNGSITLQVGSVTASNGTVSAANATVSGTITTNSALITGNVTIQGNTVNLSNANVLLNVANTIVTKNLFANNINIAGNISVTGNIFGNVYSNGLPVLTSANIVDSIFSTSITSMATANAARWAFDAANANAIAAYVQANAAYAAANAANVVAQTGISLAIAANTEAQSVVGLTATANTGAQTAANLVAVYANGTLIIANANVNFVNSSSVTVGLSANAAHKQANVTLTFNIPLSGAELSAGLTSANIVNPTQNPGYLLRYGNNIIPGVTDMSAALNIAALQSSQTNGAAIVVTDTVAFNTNVSIPLNAVLKINPEGFIKIASGKTLTVNGTFIADRINCFSIATGMGFPIFTTGSLVDGIYPEWFGMQSANGAGGSLSLQTGPDNSNSINAAMNAACLSGTGDVGIHLLNFTEGDYIVGSVVLPNGIYISGQTNQTTNFICKQGVSGSWWTDSGNPAHTILENFRLYANNVSTLNYALNIGNGPLPWGSEGYLDTVWVEGCGATTTCAIINGNVLYINRLATYGGNTGLVMNGYGNELTSITSVGQISTVANTPCINLSYCAVTGLEIEAPANNQIFLKLNEQASVRGLYIEPANNSTFDHFIEIGPSATTWSLLGLNYGFDPNPVIIVTGGGNILRLADGTYFGGNAQITPQSGSGNFYSETQGMQPVNFMLRLTNTLGNVQHRITSGDATNQSQFAGLIGNASTVYINTPTQTDSSTPFSNGVKVSSVTPSMVLFDTPAQAIGYDDLIATVCYNSTGVALTAIPSIVTNNVDGVVRYRMGVQLVQANNGSLFQVSTANIGLNQLIEVKISGYLSP